MQANIMGIPVYNTNSANLKTFPQLGAFPGEVGSGTSVGGINNSGTWIDNIPLAYWFNMGKKSKRSKRSKKSYKKLSKKCKKVLSRKISKNMKEMKKGRWSSKKQALAISYSQARKICSKK